MRPMRSKAMSRPLTKTGRSPISRDLPASMARASTASRSTRAAFRSSAARPSFPSGSVTSCPSTPARRSRGASPGKTPEDSGRAHRPFGAELAPDVEAEHRDARPDEQEAKKLDGLQRLAKGEKAQQELDRGGEKLDEAERCIAH